jgi:xanthine dehydrogenase accessory factor
MKQLIEKITILTAQNESFALATVITRKGSAPRSAGARMLVRADGTTAGTVGGGILEANVTRLAVQVLDHHTALVENFQFSGEDAASMDSICGGQVDVLVEWVDGADPGWKAVLAGITVASAQHKKAWLLTALPAPGAPPVPLAHGIVQRDGDVVGDLPAGFTVETIFETLQPEMFEAAGQDWWLEPLETGGTVYIFGAGHVGRSLASFTRAVGFRTVILDDRPEFANPSNVPFADETILLPSYDELFTQRPVDANSFIVIVTRGHLNDQVVLAQALRTPAAYIGMIGSRRKCALIFEDLRSKGFSEADIRRIHAPIGLPIHAETPEEIGISITAEMIQVRAGLSGE